MQGLDISTWHDKLPPAAQPPEETPTGSEEEREKKLYKKGAPRLYSSPEAEASRTPSIHEAGPEREEDATHRAAGRLYAEEAPSLPGDFLFGALGGLRLGSRSSGGGRVAYRPMMIDHRRRLCRGERDWVRER
ncbi:hypothetical protein CDD83_5165 [Cordyceps sp. RAO-2017]|nr:hypothetical protein CDD83_5165 [Cordyceps sp. RAO-2017]